jgi:SAM-dependent methyltransferase
MRYADEKKQLIENYRECFRQYGDTPEAVQLSSDGQLERFEKLAQIAQLDGCSVLDIGCGLGHLYPFLKARFSNISYTGVDLCPDSVAHAAGRYPEASFRCLDLTSQSIGETFDFVLMSGLFNNSFAGSDDYMHELLRTAFQLCKKGMAFNFISTYVSRRDAEMAYHAPSAVLDFCIAELSPKVSLYHHYTRCDVALFVYRA